MADPTDIGARLKAVRIDRNVSPQLVADELGCSKANVFHIEAGRQQPSVVQLKKLATMFGCLMEQLIDGPLPIGEALTPLLRAAPAPLEPHPFTGEDTREMARQEIEAALNRREAADAADTLRRLGIPLTPEQRELLAASA